MPKKKLSPFFMYDQEGKKIGVFLKEKEFEALIDELEELYDFQLIQKRKKKKEKLYTHAEVVAETRARMEKK